MERVSQKQDHKKIQSVSRKRLQQAMLSQNQFHKLNLFKREKAHKSFFLSCAFAYYFASFTISHFLPYTLFLKPTTTLYP